jgi:MFS family permease
MALVMTLIVENAVADIGGESSKTWLALVHSLGLAAVAPFAGALSDLVGRRYLGMLGAAVVVVGMIVVGLANSMEVAIIGMAITGAGGAFTGVIGFSGICELVPVHSRGRYIGSIFLVFFPMAPASAYGLSFYVNADF